MLIPKRVALLGFVVRTIWTDYNGKTRVDEWPGPNSRSKRERLALCANGSGKKLFFLPWSDNVNPSEISSGGKRAKKLFEVWSDFEADSAFSMDLDDLNLSPIGMLRTIEYESDKWGGTLNRYVHDFRSPAELRKTDSSPAAWGVQARGKKLVGRRGIVG